MVNTLNHVTFHSLLLKHLTRLNFLERKPSEDKACQVPEAAQSRQGHESVGDQRKRDLRKEIMSEIDKLLGNYTSLGDKGVQAIMRDILTSKKFRGQFADVFTTYQESSSGDTEVSNFISLKTEGLPQEFPISSEL